MSDTSKQSCDLAQGKCVPCQGGVDPMQGEAIEEYLSRLDNWSVVDEKKLEKEFKFKNFRQALTFTNQVGELAEEQKHHPDITLSWGKVGVQIWTHKIGGLHENDFILAAKIDKIEKP